MPGQLFFAKFGSMNRDLPPLSEDFRESMQAIGLDAVTVALDSTDPTVSVRLRRGEPRPGWCADAQPVPWCADGLILSCRPDFTRDPAFHQGVYYVQEAASMFVWHVLRSVLPGDAPLWLLDACAAPGGKTTAAIDALPQGSIVVANELSPQRAEVLRENVIKHGSDSVIVTRGDASLASRLQGVFDVVLLDAPCSGEGMMRRDATARTQWSPVLVAECARRQRVLATRLWEAVKPGGVMVYSTCTFNRSEDEEVLTYIIEELGAEPVAVPVESTWHISPGIDTPYPCCRFFPGHTPGEGLFMAVVRKPSDSAGLPERKSFRPGRPKPAPAESERLVGGETYIYEEKDGALRAIPQRLLPLLKEVEKAGMKVIHAGVEVGERAGREYAPTQALAMSKALAPGAFPHELPFPRSLYPVYSVRPAYSAHFPQSPLPLHLTVLPFAASCRLHSPPPLPVRDAG